MRIGIVALTFEPGKAGGVEIYFRDLLAKLEHLDNINEYLLFLPSNFATSISFRSKSFKIIPVVLKMTFPDKIASKLGLKSSPANRAAKIINHYSCDIVHFPLQIVYPSGITAPKVLSFMDLQQEYYPEFFSPQDLKARANAYRPSAEQADHVIAISEFTKKGLVEKYGIPKGKITTIYLSYNEELFDSSSLEEPHLPPCLFYPAATWPHKNHLRLIEAFAEVIKKHPDVKLILTGIKKHANDEIVKKIENLHLTERITIMGYLPYNHLPLLYRKASGLIFPSLFEGFGIPLLEAMASDCPIAASNTTSIPEVAGAAAIYFDPLSISDIADKMNMILTDVKLREKLIRAGRQRVKQFSSAKMAKETLAIYKKVAEKSGS